MSAQSGVKASCLCGAVTLIPLGLFADDVSPVFGLQVFVDRKPPSYTFADETKELTEAQVYEIYAPKS